ncbi:hypothetical protein DFJ43DRAFT_1042602 [Lentinula guzmanii]|uniref:Uncharacterized protein n=1 Tax=Lentinula guzmanii TaxID=2804957 RepID=A0AA38JCJ1_9AGAR|nr:hypothetical protein DFJ43DRAFT_1042602 [Lentinula guzmanii]
MSLPPLVVTANAEYSKIKEEIISSYDTYANILSPHLISANKHTECLVHATNLGESTARLMNFVPNLLAAPRSLILSSRSRAPKSAPMVIDSSSGEDDDVSVVGGDIAMGDSTLPTATPAVADHLMSLHAAIPGATLLVEPTAAIIPPVATGLSATVQETAPIAESNNSTRAQAVHFVKRRYEEARKRQRSVAGLDYINAAAGSSLAFPNSVAQITAASSSATSSSAVEITDKAKSLVSNISISSKSERGLIKQESDLHSELDVTINRLHYLLQYFDLVKAQHVQVLKDLHLAGSSVE